MYRHGNVVILLAGVAATSLGWAQSVPVASSPAGPSTAAVASGPAGQSASRPVTTLKGTADLVVGDVVVTDRDHKPVHGLNAENFAVTEGGVPQTIKHFEEHTALTVADA